MGCQNYNTLFVFIIVLSSLIKYPKFGSMSVREAGLLWKKSQTHKLSAGLFFFALAPQTRHLVRQGGHSHSKAVKMIDFKGKAVKTLK